MKKVLFIIPSIWAGGTHSSLSSIIAHYNPHLWNVSVYAITGFGVRESSYKKYMLPQNKVLASLYSHGFETKGGSIYFWKVLDKLLRYVKIDFRDYMTRKVVRQLESDGYDSVVGFMEGNANYMASLFKCMHKVAWIHCNYDMYLPKGKSEEETYRKFDSIVCVSQYTKSVFQNRYPDLAPKTEYVYNLLDAKRIAEMAQSAIDDACFEKCGLTLISVGRITSVKRFSSIPRIAHELKKRGLSFKWYLIGPDFDAKETSLLKTEIIKYNVSDFFTWMGGKQNPYPYFKASDIYVCLSESEACPMVFNEARIFGLPIVTTDFPSSVEFIDNGEDGIITSFNGVTDALEQIMNSPMLLNRMRASSCSRNFDNEQIMKKIETII